MRANPSKDTLPELRLRSLLHRRGYRFRANARLEASGLHVQPDLVFRGQRLAVFVDGCFWHSCPEHGNTPRANAHYWVPKLRRVLARDHAVGEALARDGWRVLRVWEHTPLEDAVALVVAAHG
jgi:DNA mismatch endonuclease (patch repair protein)